MKKDKQPAISIRVEGDEVVYTIKGVTYREKMTKEELIEVLKECGFGVIAEDFEH